MFLVQQKKVAQAVHTMRFENISNYFRRIGEAPNTTDEECLDWIVAVSARPVINFLRAEVVNANEPKAFISSFIDAGREHFDVQPKLQAMISQLEAIRTLFEVVEPNPGSEPPKASLVRKSLATIDGMGKSALSLAFQHGPVGKMLRASASKIITQSAHDCIAREKLSVAQANLAAFLETGHVCPSQMSGSEVWIAVHLRRSPALWSTYGGDTPCRVVCIAV